MDDPRSPDQLLHEALAIRRLLDDTASDDHAARIRLVASQDQVRLAAAREWRARGWRPITESTLVRRPQRTLLLPPAVAAVVAAGIVILLLDAHRPTMAWLVAASLLPLLAEHRRLGDGRVRQLAALGAGVLGLYVVSGTMPVTFLFLPAAALLVAIALLGTVPRDRRLHVPDEL